MTQALPERPSLRSRRPWSNRTTRTSDIAAAVTLSIGEIAVFAWATYGYGITTWAAQGDQDEIDEATLANIAWMEHFLCVVLALAALAALSRAPWTTVSHLLAAGLVAVLVMGSRYEYDRDHPAPAPTRSAHCTPCLSGSGEMPLSRMMM
ncbi:DUF6234 family protein [Streptomyces prunicolor]